MAIGAVVNAVWDLAGQARGQAVWQLLADMSPEWLVGRSTSATSPTAHPDEALELLRERQGRAGGAPGAAAGQGYPAYTTSAGWLGYERREAAPAVPRRRSPRASPRSS
jgi:L-alanine-DL-glutamate epimerase-like enolase superfamily enzyme